MTIPAPSADVQITKLISFRQAAYERLGCARDAQFELTDAVLVTPAINSYAELALSPVFRREWSSLYEAIEDGRPNRYDLARLYVSHIPSASRPVLAGDHTTWARLSAYTLADRTIEHQPTKVPGNRPITLGQGFSTLAWIPEPQGSWALPVLHERIASHETVIDKGISQLRQICVWLSERPISLWDAEYGCAPFINGSADIPADKIVRLRSNLCLLRAPGPYSGRGRPALHGAKFKLKDATTWGTPELSWVVDDPSLGQVRISVWCHLHFRRSACHPMRVVCIQRLAARGTQREPSVVWLAWVGEEPPAPTEWWHYYLRRFAVDHWYRFAKQRLHWTLPHFGTPAQAERWSDLMPFLTWELWLARGIVADHPLPWQKPQTDLTPGRVCRGMGGILAVIGTPAQPPKPRGKSSGWRKGRIRQPKTRHPIVKKSQKRRKKAV